MIELIASMTWKNPLFMLVFFAVIWYLPGLILRRRRYNIEDYKILISKLNKIIPNICIGVDVIVGYPNETE